MSPLPAMPIGDPVEDASIDTTGEAFLIPTALNSGAGAVVTHVKVYCSAKCYVGFNNDNTPDATVANRDRAVQQAATEEVYTRAARRGADLPYVVVSAASGTVAADISYFG